MPEKTANLGLTKPLVTEKYDVGVFNANSEILDAAHAEMNRRINELKDISPPVKEVADYTQGDVFDFSIMDVGMCFEILYDSTTEFEDAPELLPLGGETGRMIFEVEELPSGAAVQTIVCLGKCGGVFRRDGVGVEWNEWRMISAPKMEIVVSTNSCKKSDANTYSLDISSKVNSFFPWLSNVLEGNVYSTSVYYLAPPARLGYAITSADSCYEYLYLDISYLGEDKEYSYFIIPEEGGNGHINSSVLHLTPSDRPNISKALCQSEINKSSIGLQSYNLLKNVAETTTVNGVTFTVNEDKTVTVNGTATDNATLYIGKIYFTDGTIYHLNGAPESSTKSNYCYRYRRNDESIWSDAVACTIQDLSEQTFEVMIVVKSGQTAENIVFKPMVCYSNVAGSEYKPYTDDLQTQINNIWQNQYDQDDQIATAVLNSGEALIDIKEIRDILAVVKSDTAVTKATVGMERKNLLKNTASAVTKNGITFTVNADGSVTAGGTATANTTFDIGKIILEAGTEYILNGCPEGGSDTSYYLYGLYTLNWAGTGGKDTGEGYEFAAPWNGEVVFRIYIASGATVSGLTFYPMLRYAAITDDDYEQYKPSIEERLAALETTLAALTTEGGE